MQYLIYTFILFIIALLAFIKLFSTYNISSEKKNNSKLSGFEVARKIMDKNKLDKLYIVERKGSFTDIYVQKQKVVKLSTSVFNDENLYSTSMSSYIASYSILSNQEDKIINLKLSLDQLFKYITHFMYIILIIGLCLNSENIYKVTFFTMLIIFIYRIIAILIDKKTIYLAYDELKELNLFTKEEEKDIVNILKTIRFYNLSTIILSLHDGINTIKEIINNSKR